MRSTSLISFFFEFSIFDADLLTSQLFFINRLRLFGVSFDEDRYHLFIPYSFILSSLICSLILSGFLFNFGFFDLVYVHMIVYVGVAKRSINPYYCYNRVLEEKRLPNTMFNGKLMSFFTFNVVG